MGDGVVKKSATPRPPIQVFLEYPYYYMSCLTPYYYMFYLVHCYVLAMSQKLCNKKSSKSNP